MTVTDRSITDLNQLARLYGVQTSYMDMQGRKVQASPDTLRPVLVALGALVDGTSNVRAAIRMRRQATWQQSIEPIVLAWDGRAEHLEMRLPSTAADGALHGHLRLESGETRSFTWDLSGVRAHKSTTIGRDRHVAKSIPWGETLPIGYHRLTLEAPSFNAETMIISAPIKSFAPSREGARPTWGVFLPLYALHSERSWGAGDFTDLEALIEWTDALGGGGVATLPMLAAYLDEPCDPSPYSPISRMLWNEFYIDVTRIPDWSRCPDAARRLESAEFRAELNALRSLPHVDYRRQMRLKRDVLADLAETFFAERSERSQHFESYLQSNPIVCDYARFRAAGERFGTTWPDWPDAQRNGRLGPGDCDPSVERYHQYVQWIAHEQIESLAQRARARGTGLYLDLPLGVHPHGFDVWRHRAAFARGVSAGSPPDGFFSKGQNWGFPPLHPQADRACGYPYTIACLRHHLQLARILRLDHVMGLHRLFWIPHGADAQAGVYVQNPAEELYAILSVESHRHGSIVVGEDLGTVPRAVRPMMARHGLRRMYVGQFSVSDSEHRPMAVPSRGMVASLNTHDTPTFASFWEGLDLVDRRDLGLLDEETERRERHHRECIKRAMIRFFEQSQNLEHSHEAQDVLHACLRQLAESPAWFVLVNLEDLWLETQPQNVPGTWNERPNWQRRAKLAFDAFRDRPDVLEPLRAMHAVRRRRRAPGGKRTESPALECNV